MKILALSDTHGYLIEPELMPEADVLVHAGDATNIGSLDEIYQFGVWLKKIAHKYKKMIYVPGNHDKKFDSIHCETAKHSLEPAVTLINEHYEFEGVRFYGSPVCPPFGHWGFYWNDVERFDLWNNVEGPVDVLVTHGPAYRLGDLIDRPRHGEDPHVGCHHLYNAVFRLKPKVHIFGHIHEGYGIHRDPNLYTTFVNASLRTARYKIEFGQMPIMIELDGDKNVTSAEGRLRTRRHEPPKSSEGGELDSKWQR